jgi:hypothetical protein
LNDVGFIFIFVETFDDWFQVVQTNYSNSILEQKILKFEIR